MARFQLCQHAWPIEGGAKLVPVGTMLDRDDWQWNGSPLPWPPPVNAMALDQEAYDALLRHYLYWQVVSVDGVRRHGDP